jgi:hypothetical protein
MTSLRARLLRIGFILGLLAFLASGISIEPNQVMARPVGTGGPDGEPYGTGDPTGDDIPSPTPKPTLRAAKVDASGSQTQRQGSYVSFDRWNIYVHLLIRLGIR